MEIHRTKVELYKLARLQNIRGRSHMSKAELYNALFGKPFVAEKLSPLQVGRILRRKTAGSHGYTCFAYQRGVEEVRYRVGAACFAEVWNMHDLDILVMDVGFMVGRAKEADYIEPLEYLLNESIYRNIFLTKSWAAAKISGIVCDTKQNLSNMVAGVIAVRQLRENSAILDTWKWIRGLGYSKHVAWLGSQTCSPKSWFQIVSGHCELNGSMSLKGVLSNLPNGLHYYKTKKQGNETHYFVYDAIAMHSLAYATDRAIRSDNDPSIGSLCKGFIRGLPGRWGYHELDSFDFKGWLNFLDTEINKALKENV